MTEKRKLGEALEPGEDEIEPQWKEPDSPDDFVREAACDDQTGIDQEGEQKGEHTGASQ